MMFYNVCLLYMCVSAIGYSRQLRYDGVVCDDVQIFVQFLRIAIMCREV